MNSRVVIVTATLLFGAAVYGLHTDKMRVTTFCRDSRMYMDGGVDANIESGGLNYHHDIQLYRLKNMKHELIGSFLVSAMSAPKDTNQTYVSKDVSGNDVKLSIFKTEPSNAQGYPGHLDGTVKGEKISVDVRCLAKLF